MAVEKRLVQRTVQILSARCIRFVKGPGDLGSLEKRPVRGMLDVSEAESTDAQ